MWVIRDIYTGRTYKLDMDRIKYKGDEWVQARFTASDNYIKSWELLRVRIV